MKIYKYELYVATSQEVRMPVGATILTLQLQNKEPCIWATVPHTPYNNHGLEVVYENRRFITVGTGHIFDETNLIYIGTYQQGFFVGHVFEDRNI